MRCGIIAVPMRMEPLSWIMSDGYTSNTMQQMLRLVDKGVRLATEAKLDDIKSYCFEVIDMCYLGMDFETCESDYPDLCSAYNEYVAEKRRNVKVYLVIGLSRFEEIQGYR